MSAKVLVVDDIEVNVRLLEAKLLSEYYDVLAASDGPSAIELARTQTPDIILLDVMMPGMDGLEVCRRLKADPVTRYIPVVMVTALSDVADRLRGLDVGADDFLTKPVNDIALFARVRSLIRLKRTLDEWLLREEVNGQLASLTPTASNEEFDKIEPERILVLEDNSLAGNKLAQILSPYASSLTVVKNRGEALQSIATDGCDTMIISMALEHEDPLRLLSQLRAAEQTRHIPVLLVIDEGDYARLAKGLDLGANDYIFRPVDRNELIARFRIQARRKQLQERLLDNYKRGVTLALTDELTGLYNRRYLMAHLDTLLGRTGGPARDLTLLMFDVDRFKSVNDTWGHPVGDQVLIEIAKRAQSGVRGFDLASRFGGEEFVIVLPDTGEAAARAIAERLRRSIADHKVAISSDPPSAIPITVSIGIASTGLNLLTPAALLKAADDALLEAKRTGRNRVMAWQTGGPVLVSPPAG
jgi:two-component system cell cycle response regulator